MTASRRRHRPRHPRRHDCIDTASLQWRSYTAARFWQNRCVLDGLPPVMAKLMDSSPTTPSDIRKVHRPCQQLRHSAFFAPPTLCSFIIHSDYTIDHDYLDHGYITMVGYFDINGYVYNNSSATTPVNSVRLVTCVHDTPVVTMGGEGRKAPEGDAVTALTADPSQTQLMMV